MTKRCKINTEINRGKSKKEESHGPIEKVLTSTICFWIHFFALFFFFTFSTINFLVYLASFCHLLFVLLCPDLLSILFLINRHISQFRLFEFRTSSYLFFLNNKYQKKNKYDEVLNSNNLTWEIWRFLWEL